MGLASGRLGWAFDGVIFESLLDFSRYQLEIRKVQAAGATRELVCAILEETYSFCEAAKTVL